MTYDFEINRYKYVKKPDTGYKCLYDADEYDTLANEVKRIFKREFTNETCVRLDDCCQLDDCAVLTVSRINFYDFLLTNFSFFNRAKILDQASVNCLKGFKKLYDRIASDGGVSDFESIINKNYLSNALAVSCLLTDGKSALMTKRNSKVGIANNFYSTTVTGSVDGTDFDNSDLIISCCTREFGEEMNGILLPDQMNVKKIVCGESKIQPIALVDVRVDNLHTFAENVEEYSHFFDEHSSYKICSYDEIETFLQDENAMITEAARTHLEGTIK